MIYAEKVFAQGRDWVKASIKNNSRFLAREMSKVKGAICNPKTGLWAIPYENKADFINKMGNYLIIWMGEDYDNPGGIPEESIPSYPIVPGYSVKYDSEGNILSSEGFKTMPWGEFQVKGFNALVTRDFLILADDAGLGKSWEVSTAMEARKKLGQLKRGIVICKASLLFNWRDEIHMHTNEKAVIAAGSIKQRTKLYNDLTYRDDWTFLIISYETFREDIACLQGLDNMKGLDFCITDEGHKFKNPLSRIGTVIHYIPFRFKYVLTATPLPNSPLEAYNYLHWGGKTSRNWWAFRNKYAVMGGYNNKEIVGYKNITELQKVVQSNMLRRLKKHKLKELPDVVFKTIGIEMTKAQAKLYNAVKEDVLTDLTDTTLEQIPSALTKLLRLQQITDSPALIGAKGKSAKLETLDDMLEGLIENSDEKVIVFSRFRGMVELLQKRYKKYNPAIIHGDIDANGLSEKAAELRLMRQIPNFLRLPKEEREKLIEETMTSERQREVYRFQNDDSCKLFIGSSAACREGLTLTAATHVIFLDCEWAWDYVEQAYSRAHRIGQKNAVTVYYIVCSNTIDEHVQNVILTKKAVSEEILAGGPESTTPLAREFVAQMIGVELKKAS